MPNNQISLNPTAIARVLGAITFFLVLASIAGQLTKFLLGHDYVKGFVPLFDVNQERNIPTFFSVLLLLGAALLLAVITRLKQNHRAPHVSKWATLTVGFVFMAFDEAFQVHEYLVAPVTKLLGDGHLGVFYFAWVIPGIALVFALGIFFLKFLLYLPPLTRMRFLIAGTIYVGGAIGFELIGGRYFELHRQLTLTYSMMATIEETLEMVGVIVFIWALLVYLADNHKEVRFEVSGEQEKTMADAP